MIAYRLLTFVALFVFSGCDSNVGSSAGSSAAKRSEVADAKSAGTSPISDAETAKVLLAAAEPFEVLTETAFGAKPNEIDASIADVEKAVVAVGNVGPKELHSRLQSHLVSIRANREPDNRADLALASIEGFRDIISAIPGSPRVPVDIGLLDYAGFRFDSDVQATPPRWQDMTIAATFARERWSNVESLPALAMLKSRFASTLDAMDSAIKSRSVVMARRAAKAELDMVDELENAFPESRAGISLSTNGAGS